MSILFVAMNTSTMLSIIPPAAEYSTMTGALKKTT